MVMLTVVWGLWGQEKTFKYYNLERVDTVKGTITAIETQQSYHKHQFIIVELQSADSGPAYSIEVCPQWFFQLDLVKGMEIEATGSLTGTGEQAVMMARSLRYGGEIHYFRDENGFPLWRGQRRPRGQGKGVQRRRQGRR